MYLLWIREKTQSKLVVDGLLRAQYVLAVPSDIERHPSGALRDHWNRHLIPFQPALLSVAEQGGRMLILT